MKKNTKHISLAARVFVLAVCLSAFVVFGDAQARPRGKTQNASVGITEHGYQPAAFRLRRGIPARVTFLRKTDTTCGTEVVFPDYGITRELPLNTPVLVRFTPTKSGEFTFTCGMQMMRGKVIVR